MNIVGCYQYTLLCVIELLLALVYKAFSTMPKSRKKRYLFFALGILAFFTMFHDSTIGNDTSNYIAMFNRIASSNPISYAMNTGTESGFIIYCWLLSKVSSNAQILFIVTGFFVYVSIYRFFYKYIENPGLLCYLMVAMNQFDFFISAQRQAISIAILLFAFDYLKGKRMFMFVFLTLLAFLFHNTAIVYIFVYFFVNVIMKRNTGNGIMFYVRWFSVVFAIFIGFTSIWSVLLRVFPKYTYYEGGALVDGVPRLAIALKVIVYCILFIISIFFTDKNRTKHSEEKLYRFLSLLNLSIVLISWNATALNRLSSDFLFFPGAQFSNALLSKKSKKNNNAIILITLTIVLFYIYGFIIVALKTPDWYTTYPIKIIWS